MQLEDEDLFQLDTQPDDAQAHIVSHPKRRKRADKTKRMTRAQAILAAGTQAKPLGNGAAYAPKKRAKQPSKTLAVMPSRCAPPARLCLLHATSTRLH
jgi:hypothetical protein